MNFRLLALAAVLLLTACAAYAADDEVKADPRLDQKVTYEAKGLALHKVLEELTEKTEVKMTCGNNEKDWEVRDRKLTIFVKDMPLRDLQTLIAHVLHFTWARGGTEGAYTYRLFQSLKAKNEQANLLEKAKEEEARKQKEKRETALEALDNLDSLSPEEIEKLKEESPLLYIFAKEPMGKGITQMLKSSPELRGAILEGREATLDLSAASPGVADGVRLFLNGMNDLVQRIEPSFSPGFDKLADNLSGAKIVVNRNINRMSGGGFETHAFAGEVEIHAEGSPHANIPIFDPTSPIAKVFGKIFLGMLEGKLPNQMENQMESEMMKAIQEIQKLENPEALLPEDDPDLKRKVKLGEMKNGDLPDLLENLAKNANLQFVSDHFPQGMSMGNNQSAKEEELGNVLNLIATLYGKVMDKSANLIVLIDKKWFEKRTWEVKEEWLEDWRKAAKEGALDFDDIVDIACLTDLQITKTIAADQELRMVGWQMMANKDILRLYAVLTKAQQEALKTDHGLDAASLSADQWSYLQYALDNGGGRTGPEVDKSSPMTLHLKDHGEIYRIELNGSPEEPSDDSSVQVATRVWHITIPTSVIKYAPPSGEPDDAGEKEVKETKVEVKTE